MDPVVGSYYFTCRSYQLARGVRNLLALLFQVRIQELLVIAARNKTNFLRIRLLEQTQPGTLRFLADLGLAHLTQRKQRPAQLLLRQAEQKVCLVFGEVCRTLQYPPPGALVVLIARVMSCSEQVGADLARGNQQLIELQMVVAKAARNRGSPGKIIFDEGTHHVLFEARLLIDDVVRNAKLFGYVTGVVHIVDGTTATLHRFGHALVARQAALVPELHGEANDLVPALAEHGRDGRRIDTARHGYSYGL